MDLVQESSFQTFINYLSEPRVIVKSDAPRFTIVAFNESYSKISNTVGKDIRGLGFKEIYGNGELTDDDSIVVDALNRAIASKEIVKLGAVRYDIPAADGTLTQSWWQAVYKPISAGDGRPSFVMCTIFNITDNIIGREALEQARIQQENLQREQALNEELAETNRVLIHTQQRLQQLNLELEDRIEARTRALTESEGKTRTILTQLPIPLIILRSGDFMIEMVNQPMLDLLQRSRDNLIGKTVLDILPELAEQGIPEQWYKVIESGRSFRDKEVPVYFYNNSGQKVFLYLNYDYHPLFDHRGEVSGLMVTIIDLTEQVSARNELKETQEILNLALDAAGLGTWSVNVRSGEIIMSERTRKMYGIPNDRVITQNEAGALIAPEHREQFKQVVFEAIATNGKFNEEISIHPLDGGKPLWIKASGKPYFDEAGKVLLIAGLSLDITEQKMDEFRKNAFIGMVSHELKTPLTSLNAYAQLLHSKASKTNDVFTIEALDKMNKQVRKMSNMVNGFLDISRLESGRIQLNVSRIDLRSIVAEYVEDAMLLTTSHNLTITNGAPVWLYADADKIGSVISNLISNAIKYSAKGTMIVVNCEITGNHAQVSVSDEGVGINQQDIEKLFERYYRVESDDTRHISGFGIGLYLSAEIIKQHKGKIWVDSQPGKGSTFYFSLPIG
jgi:PAS domain S-box-containing protein